MNPALRLASIAIGFCVYAGLAILGWAGFRSFFSHPALIALVAVLFSLSGLTFFAGGNLSPGVREARGNRWVIPVLMVIGLVNAYLPAYTDRKVPPLICRINAEEDLLRAHFGYEHIAYSSHTWRLVPGIY